MSEPKPTRAPRKPRVNYAAEHARISQYCRISISVMDMLVASDITSTASEYMKGQITALKAVLREMKEDV